MFDKVSTSLDFITREEELLKRWKDADIFAKSIENRADCPVFTFYDGPPTANGKPHIGHILTRAIKDIIPRYRTMKGYKVLRKAGWDTHGLPVELEVEKQLGLNGKPEIEEYGIESFIQKCKESVWKYEREWRQISERVGFWADMDNPYVTYHNSYIESVWWALKRIWEAGLIYKGHKVVPYCPRCGTALSSHEVAQGYKDIIEPSIYVKFRVKDKPGTYLLAWTTTPWTLPSNAALAVSREDKYSRVKVSDEEYIVAEELVDSAIRGPYTVVGTIKGDELLGIEYEPLFRFTDPKEKAWYVVAGSFVTLSEGTGIVHIAPAFGEDDAVVGRRHKLPFIQLVNEQGRFIDSVLPWKGVFVKDADPEIIKDLDSRNLLYRVSENEHSYPFCWRCDTPLLYYARDTWFIKMTEVREKLIANNQKINWYPENIRDGRFGNFLENVVDWGLSRERYWGTPLPIWECAGCGTRDMIGSISELKEKGIDVPDDIELHKPYIDGVRLKCRNCGESMKRVPEVIDCWFDSGSMPFAQWHYPFENNDVFDANFPADFISEALDQTRGWFYTLLAISTLLFDTTAYKNCIVLGHVQDKDGQKMSKHKGNVVDPWAVLNKQGADAIRWYFYYASAPWLPNRFSEEAVAEGQRKFMGTLWNTYAFFVLYANIDGFDPKKYKLEYAKLDVLDRWVISRLHSLIASVDDNLANYRITESARALLDFIDELSNWYVRRSRERFWQSGMPQDKINAYMTLHTVLIEVSKLAAPFVPFMADAIYMNLSSGLDAAHFESVHLEKYPAHDPSMIDRQLESAMEKVLRIVVLGRACRNKANIKNRQPLNALYVNTQSGHADELAEVIKDELNIKKLIYAADVSEFIDYGFKPQLKTVGPKYGKAVPSIAAYLADIDGVKAHLDLKNGRNLVFEIEGKLIELTEQDLLIEEKQRSGFVSESDKGVTAVLDANLDEGLIEEGFVREIVSKVQTMRKEAGFEVTDHISLYYQGGAKISSVFERNGSLILEDTLADSLNEGVPGQGPFTREWDINGENVKLGVSKL